jgi:hypothetical protein
MITDEQYARDRLTMWADVNAVDVAGLIGPSREAALSRLRRAYMQMMRAARISSTVIGRVLKRDPSTIRALWK